MQLLCLVSKSQCPNAHHSNSAMFTITDTVRNWIQVTDCPSISCAGSMPYDEIVDFPANTSTIGYVQVNITNIDVALVTGLVVMNATCDTVLAQKCLHDPGDSVVFYNSVGKFSLWFMSSQTAAVLGYKCKMQGTTNFVKYACFFDSVPASIGDPLVAGETPTYLTFPYAERVEKYPLPVGKYFEVWRDRRKSKIIWVQ